MLWQDARGSTKERDEVMKRSHDVDYFMLPLVSEKGLCNTLSVWLQMRGLDTPDVRILFQKSLIEIDAK